jgi:hypothetical protein
MVGGFPEDLWCDLGHWMGVVLSHFELGLPPRSLILIFCLLRLHFCHLIRELCVMVVMCLQCSDLILMDPNPLANDFHDLLLLFHT